ncbi:MAG: ATP-binding protein [Bdellovibrionales bacterium]
MAKPNKRPKISILHEEIPPHVAELMQLTRLAELGRLSASVAHEINNPLMVAQGFAENMELLLDSEEFTPQELRVQALEIIKACQRISRIINKMNRMSRNQKLRLHIVDVAEVALNAVDFLKTQFSDYQVELDFQFDRPLPIKCDAVQVEQIVLNILTNALHAMEENEGPRKIRVTFSELPDWHQIRIWNNGPPIPESIRDNLMMPFFTTKQEGKGTGLGLSVSKAIMQVHEGDLTYSSDAGGTEFVLSFPKPLNNPWQQSTRTSSHPVVIIDRQPNYRRTLAEKFKLLGFQVVSCSDYEEGQRVMQDLEHVTGVFLDIIPGLPEGLQMVSSLRKQLGPQGLIFTMSNYPSARDLKGELKGAGATECFEKPIHADNFTFILKLLDESAAAGLAASEKEKLAA